MAETTRRRAQTRVNHRPRAPRPEQLLVLMIRMLKDRESKPYMVQNVALNTSHAQKVFRRVYDKLSHALYRSDEVLMTVDAKMASRLQATMDKNYQQLYDKLSQEEMRLDAMQEAEGVSGDVHYTVEREEKAVIYSPRAMRFVILMRTLDRIVTKIDLLHISGIIETTHAALAKWTWQRTITAFANEIIMASNTALQRTRQSLISKTQKEREKMFAKRTANTLDGGDNDAATKNDETSVTQRRTDDAGMPETHEIDQALEHQFDDVEFIPENDDDDDIAQIAPRGRARASKTAATAG